MGRRRPSPGTVIELDLPSGRYAYGRVLKDAGVAFYAETSEHPSEPPIGSRDFQFTVGVYEDVLLSDQVKIVGHDPSRDPEEDWPPPAYVKDPISGRTKIYHRGIMRPARPDEEVAGLERAAVWDFEHIVQRLEGEWNGYPDER